MSYDPARTTWTNPRIEYMFNTDIIEYDIQDAGFSIIKQYQLLPPNKIKELELIPKGSERHIAIGNLQKHDKEFTRRLLSKFSEIRGVFIRLNDITDNRLISVKKDALFVIGECQRINFDLIHFVPKHRYSSYIRFPGINNMEIYYNETGLDIKGMGGIAVNRHRIYMYEFIRQVISMIESHDSGVKRKMMKFIEDYKVGNLDDAYYVEFNAMSRSINALFNYQQVLVPLVQIIHKELE